MQRPEWLPEAHWDTQSGAIKAEFGQHYADLAKLKAEQDLQRIKVEAQQAIAKAQGDAEAIRISAQAIQNQGGEAYVKLKAVEKWDGKLPHYNGGSLPMIQIGK